MPIPAHMVPVWQHTMDGLAVAIGQRTIAALPSITEWFTHPEGPSTTDDPATDLVDLEGQIRQAAAALTAGIKDAVAEIGNARAAVDGLTGPVPWLSLRRRQRITAHATLRTAIQDHARLVGARADVRARQDEVRQFVIDLDCPDGLLSEAAAGWQRSPERPYSVQVFDDETAFLADDRRVATSRTWYSAINGCEKFGQGWRRDGDDDGPDTQPLDRTGPWAVGHIPTTGEIYASRRCGYLPQQVWLLGTGFATSEAHSLLHELAPYMHEPNSLILAAEVVHHARPVCSAGDKPRLTTSAMRRNAMA